MKEILFNNDDLKKEEIDEVVVRLKALIINSKNEILLGLCNKTYQFPGGHLEEGETIDQGLIREVREEAGIDISDIDYKLFQKTTYYTKNYRNSGLNRENDIYYFIVKTDREYNPDNRDLDDYEIEGNYRCVSIPLDNVKNVLEKSIPDNPMNKIIAREMIEVIEEYERIQG